MMGDEQTEQKDVFDELMEEEIDEEALREEESAEEGEEKTSSDTGGEEEPEEEPVTVESLKTRIDELEKESKGRYKELKNERKTRQSVEGEVSNLKGRLDQITELFSKAKESGGRTDDEDEKIIEGIPVSFDEDGNPFIDPKNLEGIEIKGGKETKDTAKKVDDIEAREKMRELNETNQKTVQNILSGDDKYPDAYKRLGKAYQFIDKKLGEILDDMGMEPDELKKKPDPLNAALDLLEGSKKVVKEFQVEFPGIDMESIIEAQHLTAQGQVNTRKLKKALNALKVTSSDEASEGKEAKDKLKTLKTITKKASNLSTMRNQRGSEGVSLDDIANMKIEDFENLSKDSIKQLEKLLYEEEVSAYK